MSRSRGHESAPKPIQRIKPRRYPWIFDLTALAGAKAHVCEACKERAVFSLKYEWQAMQRDLTVLFLCSTHARIAKSREGLVRVLQLVDKKVEGL